MKGKNIKTGITLFNILASSRMASKLFSPMAMVSGKRWIKMNSKNKILCQEDRP